jgi:hypothetical protein
MSYLPDGWSVVAEWQADAAGGAYLRAARDAPPFAQTLDAVRQYDAIWVRSAPGNAAQVNPNPSGARTLELRKGWNNFVYTGASKSVADALDAVKGKYDQVLHFENTGGAWQSYLPGQPRHLNDFGGLLRMQVYWILMREDASLTIR